MYLFLQSSQAMGDPVPLQKFEKFFSVKLDFDEDDCLSRLSPELHRTVQGAVRRLLEELLAGLGLMVRCIFYSVRLFW